MREVPKVQHKITRMGNINDVEYVSLRKINTCFIDILDVEREHYRDWGKGIKDIID